MSGPAARFDSDTEKLENVRSAEQGDYLHEYTGKLTETDTSVRILTIAPALAADDQAVDAFTQISDQWYNAGANANIVTVLEQDTDPRPWIALSRATGKTLRTVRSNLSPTAIETVVSETADALRTLGLYNTVHGHPSPSNIWVEESASDTAEPTVRLGGFGLEDAVRAAVGEPEPTAYTAPELLDDPGQSSEQTDVYGLGAVTYFALTGRPPVAGDDLAQAIADGPDSPPSEYVETLSSDVDDVVIQALSKRPDDRQESPYAFSRAFLSAFSPEQLGISDSTQEEPEDSQATSPSGQEAADTATTDGSNETTDSTRRVPPKLAIGVVGIGVLVIGGVALMTVLGGSIVGDSGDVPAEDADEDTESLLTEDANAVSAEESPSSGDGSVLDDGGSDSGAETPNDGVAGPQDPTDDSEAGESDSSLETNETGADIDGQALNAVTTAAVEDAGSYTFTSDVLSSGQSQRGRSRTRITTTTQADLDAGQGLRVTDQSVSSPQYNRNGTTTVYTEGNTSYRERITRRGINYSIEEGGPTGFGDIVPVNTTSFDQNLSFVSDGLIWEANTTTTVDGNTVARYDLASVEDTSVFTGRSDARLTDVGGTLYIDEDGVFRYVSIRYSLDAESGTTSTRLQLTLTDIGSTTVEEPDWTSTAEGAS